MGRKVIGTVSYRQEQIIADILTLYAPDGIDADLTYSRGYFYKSGEVPQPRYKFDITPQTSDTVKADSRRVPLADESCGCVIFDPPFLTSTGKSLETDKGNIILRRFGYFATESELFSYYADSLKEINRILRQGGIAIVKCQDKVASGKQYISHCFILDKAADTGLYCEDIFVLAAKTRLISPKHANQKHARKYHSYFLVLRKDKNKTEKVRREMNGIYGGKPFAAH